MQKTLLKVPDFFDFFFKENDLRGKNTSGQVESSFDKQAQTLDQFQKRLSQKK